MRVRGDNIFQIFGRFWTSVHGILHGTFYPGCEAHGGHQKVITGPAVVRVGDLLRMPQSLLHGEGRELLRKLRVARPAEVLRGVWPREEFLGFAEELV